MRRHSRDELFHTSGPLIAKLLSPKDIAARNSKLTERGRSQVMFVGIVFHFLSRDAMQSRPMLSCGVRPSVRVSVTFVHSVKTSTL